MSTDTERQLLVSLSRLDELETKIHQLRTLLPNRLLAPLAPIINPQRAGAAASRINSHSDNASATIARNPAALSDALAKSARDGVAEVEAFKSAWRTPELRSVWERVEESLRNSSNAEDATVPFLREKGRSKEDYERLLRELDEKEALPQQQQQQPPVVATDSARDQQQDWRSIVSSSSSLRNFHSQLKILACRADAGPIDPNNDGNNRPHLTILFPPAGLSLDLFCISVLSSSSPGQQQQQQPPTEWRVAPHSSSSRSPTKLESQVCSVLNARPRRWDFRYLMEMIASYANLRQQPCGKCGMLLDKQAQLPFVRREHVSTSSPTSATSSSSATATADGQTAAAPRPAGAGSGGHHESGSRCPGRNWVCYHIGCDDVTQLGDMMR